MERIFVALGNGPFHTAVLPKDLNGFQVVLGGLFFGADFVIDKDAGHVFLQVSSAVSL